MAQALSFFFAATHSRVYTTPEGRCLKLRHEYTCTWSRGVPHGRAKWQERPDANSMSSRSTLLRKDRQASSPRGTPFAPAIARQSLTMEFSSCDPVQLGPVHHGEVLQARTKLRKPTLRTVSLPLPATNSGRRSDSHSLFSRVLHTQAQVPRLLCSVAQGASCQKTELLVGEIVHQLLTPVGTPHHQSSQLFIPGRIVEH